MDWLFRPIGKFFEKVFIGIEAMSWPMDLTICFITVFLIMYWFVQIWKHRKNDKGLFKKS